VLAPGAGPGDFAPQPAAAPAPYRETITRTRPMSEVPEMTVAELKQKLDAGEPVTIIDVREPHEWDIANLEPHGSRLIPQGQVAERAEAEIPREGTVVIHCRSGARSGKAVEYLQTQGWSNLYNLKGGILGWADQVDPSMKKY
jgi:adenylyltransferase/sulfurtransferase